MKLHEYRYGSIAIFFDAARNVTGLTELPANFAAVCGDRLLIAGAPSRDAIQAAMGEIGFNRAHLIRHPVGERAIGLLYDLVA